MGVSGRLVAPVSSVLETSDKKENPYNPPQEQTEDNNDQTKHDLNGGLDCLA